LYHTSCSGARELLSGSPMACAASLLIWHSIDQNAASAEPQHNLLFAQIGTLVAAFLPGKHLTEAGTGGRFP
jgi:hypothetical protein